MDWLRPRTNAGRNRAGCDKLVVAVAEAKFLDDLTVVRAWRRCRIVQAERCQRQAPRRPNGAHPAQLREVAIDTETTLTHPRVLHNLLGISPYLGADAGAGEAFDP